MTSFEAKYIDAEKCTVQVNAKHATGCPVFQATSIVEFVANNPWIVGILLLAFGIVSTFFGGKLFPYVLASVGGGLTFVVVILIASALGGLRALEEKSAKSGAKIATAVFCFILALAVAIFVGWFVKKARRIGGTILGFAAGFFLGFTLYNLVFAQWIQHVALLVVLAFGFAIVGAFVAWKFGQAVIVYLTAFVGAYALVRGVSVFAGHFPNEITLFQELSAGTFTFENAFYGYLFGFAVLTIVGIFTQHKLGYHTYNHGDDDGYAKIGH